MCMEAGHEKHITIKDIARKAGCSTGTVDRVLHKRGRVSPEVRERIEEIIQELNYTPNVNASLLAGRRKLRIGILLPAYEPGEYWELPKLGMDEAVNSYNDQGYEVELHRLIHHSSKEYLKFGRQMITEGLDGVILSPAAFKDSIKLVRSYYQNNLPFILIDSNIEGLPSLSFIGKDPVQSGQTVAGLTHQVTRHIPGKKLIWIINLSRKLSQMYALLTREIGFMGYFSDRHLEESYRIQTFDIEDPAAPQVLNEQMKELLAQGTPHAVYVTGSRVHKIASALHSILGESRPLILGHDLIQGNIQGILEERIDFIIEEEARQQGYLAVETLIRSILNKEKVEKKQLMKLMIYTRENLPVELSGEKAAAEREKGVS